MVYRNSSNEAFTGGSGQMVVMGELLHRKCNAAIPIVDVGTDVFAFVDDREEVARIQVKTATGKPYKRSRGYSADFRLPVRQLERTDLPPLFYALVVRLRDGWGGIVVISRAKLQQLREDGVGTEITSKEKPELKLYLQFDESEPDANTDSDAPGLNVKCGKIDLTEYVNAWETLPPLRPPAPINAPD